ncbi:MAG TPA: creatininase family protein [Thermoplasmata archaeon]
MIEGLTSHEFAKAVRRKPLVIIPVGSCEEHGSHLPLCTDSFQAEEVSRRVAEALDGLICPPIRYGECRSTLNFPGTISLSSDTVRAIAYEITSELARNGVDKILMISGHAGSGHMAALREGAFKAVEECVGLKVMVLSDYEIAYDLRGKTFPENDGHAGEIETSRMLNILPESVGSSRPIGRSRPPRFMVLRDPERHFPSGVIGDSSGASKKKGREIDDYVVEQLCRLVAENFGLHARRGR